MIHLIAKILFSVMANAEEGQGHSHGSGVERTPWTNPLLGKPISSWINPPGGEPVAQFRNRIQKALIQCLKEDHCPLISSHGAVGRILLQLLQIPDRHIDNCKVHKIYPINSADTLGWQIE